MELFSAEFISQFHFLRPFFLLGLIPAVVFFFLLRAVHSHQSLWNKAIDPALLPYLLDKKLAPRQYMPLYGILLIWTLSFLWLN